MFYYPFELQYILLIFLQLLRFTRHEPHSQAPDICAPQQALYLMTPVRSGVKQCNFTLEFIGTSQSRDGYRELRPGSVFHLPCYFVACKGDFVSYFKDFLELITNQIKKSQSTKFMIIVCYYWTVQIMSTYPSVSSNCLID